MIETKNPALLAAATGLRDVVTGQVDIGAIAPTLQEIQTKHVARRSRLDKTRAALVASLVFGRAA